MISWQSLKKETKIIISILIIIGIIIVIISIAWPKDSPNLSTSNKDVTISSTHLSTDSDTSQKTTLKTSTITKCNNANKSIVGKLRKILTSDKNVKCLASLPNSKLAVGSASVFRNIDIWDIVTGEVITTLNGHTDWVRCIKVLSDGTLASGSDDKTIKIWNSQSGQLLRTLIGHTSWVMALEQLSDGLLVSGCMSGTLKIWNVTTGQIFKSTILVSNYYAYQLVLLRTGNLAIKLAGISSYFIIYNTKSDEIKRINTPITSLTALSDGNLAIGEEKLSVYAANGDFLRFIYSNENYEDKLIYCLQTLSDGNLASGSNKGDVRIWNPTNGQLVNTFKPNENTSAIDYLEILSDGSLVTISHYSTIIKIWD